MKHSFDDTIAAVTTPPGVGALSSIRISGPRTAEFIQAIFRPTKQGFPLESHRNHHGWLFNNDDKLDEVVVVYMAAPNSYTGEDVVEIDCHGGLLITRQVLELVVRQGARLAEPGEFTRRAFLNGKVGLTQAEAIVDLVNAKTDRGLRGAVNQLAGGIEGEIVDSRKLIVAMLAGIEAAIDFPDDVAALSLAELGGQVRGIRAKVVALLATADLGRAIRAGVRVAIVGQPNVGKSSLLNALLGTDRAIVDDLPGTTRDTIEELISLNGIPVIFIDTAGVRAGVVGVEGKGIARTIVAAEQADLLLRVVDASLPELQRENQESLLSSKAPVINVFNKIDLVENGLTGGLLTVGPGVSTSAINGLGITELKEAIFQTIVGDKGTSGVDKSFINLRQEESLIRANEALMRVEVAISAEMPIEALAIDLKESIIALGEANGDEVSDEVIDRIFSQFCIGK